MEYFLPRVSDVKNSSAERPLSMYKILIIHYKVVLTNGILLGVFCCNCRSNLSSWHTHGRIGTRFSILEVVTIHRSASLDCWACDKPKHCNNIKGGFSLQLVGCQCCSQQHSIHSLNTRSTARSTASYVDTKKVHFLALYKSHMTLWLVQKTLINHRYTPLVSFWQPTCKAQYQ